MNERVPCEFALVRYVPNPVRGEFANIGVLLRAAGGAKIAVRFTRDWSRVRCLDADADTEMLESLEAEIASQIGDVGPSMSLFDRLQDSLSNSVQMTAMRGTLAESLPAEMEQLLRLYVDPVRLDRRARKMSGRAVIANEMRTAFVRAGVWDLLRKRVPASEYTRAGDPLRLDCGYRNGRVRMFHAVSLGSDAEVAKTLAYSLAGLREGVFRVEKAEFELTAIVEPVSKVPDAEQYEFEVGVMESAGLRVLTVKDLERVAETARQDLRL